VKQCNVCGTENSDETAFCPACGKPMAADAPVCAEPAVSSSGGARAAGAIPQKIESHLVKAIITTLCCCPPVGIAAIVYAAQVGPNLAANNIDAASEASKKAGLWGNLAIGIWVIFQILWICFSRFIFNDAFLEILRANING